MLDLSVPCKVEWKCVACGEITICINKLDAACGHVWVHSMGPIWSTSFSGMQGHGRISFVVIVVVFFVFMAFQSIFIFQVRKRCS